jgi:hypothetical protein
MRAIGIESESFGDQLKQFASHWIAGWGGHAIVGTSEQVRCSNSSRSGSGGIWHDYNEELPYFGKTVLPLVRQAGLRK